MLLLTDLCKYIQSKIDVGEGITAGVLDAERERYIGVFDNNRAPDFRIAIGGADCTRYYKQKISILVHWVGTQREAEEKAREIFDLFYGVSDLHIAGSHIAFFAASAPQCIGFTADKVYEYVVPVEIYINKEE